MMIPLSIANNRIREKHGLVYLFKSFTIILLCYLQVHPAVIFRGLHLTQRLLPPLLNLKPSPGRLADPPQPRANPGWLGLDLVLPPKPPLPLNPQDHSPPNPTTTSTSPVWLVGGRTEEFAGLDLVRKAIDNCNDWVLYYHANIVFLSKLK